MPIGVAVIDLVSQLPRSIRFDNRKIDSVLCPYPLVATLHWRSPPPVDHPRVAHCQSGDYQDSPFPARRVTQTPSQAVGRAVLDHIPYVYILDAALRLANDESSANHPVNIGVLPDYHQSQPPPLFTVLAHGAAAFQVWSVTEMAPMMNGTSNRVTRSRI